MSPCITHNANETRESHVSNLVTVQSITIWNHWQQYFNINEMHRKVGRYVLVEKEVDITPLSTLKAALNTRLPHF